MTRRIHIPLLLALAASAGCREDVPRADASQGTASAAPEAAAPASSGAPAAASTSTEPNASSAKPACDAGNGGITLPAGFCATVFADNLAAPRHLVVSRDGIVYVALEGSGRAGSGGGVMALRDSNGDGKADQRATFGGTAGTGIALAGNSLYFAPDDRVLRFTLTPGTLAPAGGPVTVVSGLPTGGHTAKTIAVDGRGALFVNVGSRTNACQTQDRQRGVKGIDPCPELATRAGIFRFDANRARQTQAASVHFARGIRNSVAIAYRPGAGLYVVQHGLDQLSDNWPNLFNDRQNAEMPGEEFLKVEQGDDFGWPYCFYDPAAKRKVLAPEYGGDGRQTGRCTRAKQPLMAFPGHWAPESLVFYAGTMFPAQYRGGAFVAFHGSWNRAPLPQAGYRVVYVPMAGGVPSGPYRDFATGFEGGARSGGEVAHRPMGLAQGPDGALYVSDDKGGRIWRIVWRGA
ncbi:MAG TPA: PQQ-dependent sugar dehydrogenase [Longimicrobiaceae bacterium]|jgi:glucose/arabinose dehydrogenase|nr:PQQ-dependent sugar dehydrogenase [Longimicrobiaceae bacterium]